MYNKKPPNTPVNGDVDEDITTLLTNPDDNKAPTYPVPLDLHIWAKNPIFYLNVVIFIFSIFTFIVNASWGFVLGMVLSIVSIVLSFWLAFYIFSSFKQHARFTIYQIIKMALSVILFLTFLGVLLYFQIFSTSNHFSASDPPAVNTFPTACNGAKPKIYNCIRVGPDVPEGMTTTGDINFPLFKTSKTNAQNIIQGVISEYLKCQIISSSNPQPNYLLLHYRCLTPIVGYPDDFVLRLYCQDNLLYTWIHSQSRLGTWDVNVNDARVRLFLNVLTSDLFTYNKTLNDGQMCVAL